MRASSKSISNFPSHIFHPIKIQHIVRLKRFAKLWRAKAQKRLGKNREHRLNVIKQWIKTETNYVRDLNIIIHNMKTPMREKAILTQDQLKIVFANIEAILLLSERLLEQLIKIRENWEPDIMMISCKLNKFYPYLKIYSEYYNNYHIAQNIITEIKHLEDVQEISKALAMDFQSYLIKPIQGPLKYELLMKEYWTHMPHTHPDYHGVKDTIEKYTKVNTSNNDQLGQRQKIAKIIRLGKIYTELVKPGRELIRQFVASTFFIPLVKVYLLTDLILITRDEYGKQVFQKVIELDGKKSFIDYKNGKHCSDLTIIVCGIRQSTHLRFMSKNLMEAACSWIHHIIDNLLEKQKARHNILSKKYSKKQQFKTTTAMSLELRDYFSIPIIRVVCIGVYKRAVSIIKNRTYYILRLSFDSSVQFCQYIFIRFSQVQKLRQSLCSKFSSIMFPVLSPNLASIKQINVVDITLDPANTVSYRAHCIPQFLNFVFRCQKVMINPLPTLNVLGIEENFWECFAMQENQECGCKLCSYSRSLDIKQTMLHRESHIKRCEEMSKQEFCIMKHLKDRKTLLSISPNKFSTLEQQLMYLEYKQGRINYNMIYRRSKAKIQFNIRVSLMSLEHESIQIKINEASTVGEVLDVICKYFRMYNYQDFGLFIQDESQMRLLDQDQLIYHILKQSQQEIESVEEKGFCFNMKNITQWSKKIFKQKLSRLYFGKYLFLQPQIEKPACQRCNIRYRLVIEQIFYSIHKRLIVLSDSEMKRIVALYLCLRLEQQIQRLTKQNIPLQKIYNFVSSEQVTSKWILEVINIVAAERNLIQESNFFMLLFDRIFEIVQNKLGWKSMLFPVTQYKESKPIYLGINIDGLVVLEKGSNAPLLSIPIRLLKFRMAPFSVTIEFNELECRFQGNGLFNFSKLAEKYFLLNELFKTQLKKLSIQCEQEFCS